MALPYFSVIGLIFAVCVSNFFVYWAHWRTRNLPFNQGGRYHNPFNDQEHFCCVYNHKPCAENTQCEANIVGQDIRRAVLPSDLGSPTGPMWRWMANLICVFLIIFYVKRNDRVYLFVFLVCSVLTVQYLTEMSSQPSPRLLHTTNEIGAPLQCHEGTMDVAACLGLALEKGERGEINSLPTQ